MNKTKTGSIVAFVISLVAGVVLTNLLTAAPSHTKADTPQAAAPTSERTKTEPAVAGANTTITAPAGVEVVVNDTPAAPKPAAKPAPKATQPKPPAAPVAPAAPAPTPSPPAAPVEPTPETVIVNLRTPIKYTLKPGQQSKLLRHEMVDGVTYEWKPGLATTWRNEAHDQSLPVWSTIQLDKPAQPYISDHIPFVIQAAANAQPGTYDVKIIIVIREGVELGVPVSVTVSNK